MGYIKRILRQCHSLQFLDLSYLFGAVDDHTILTVKEFCPHLLFLNVKQCSKVTSSRHFSQLRERGVEITLGKSGKINPNYQKILGQI